jgi:hypothetical protein
LQEKPKWWGEEDEARLLARVHETALRKARELFKSKTRADNTAQNAAMHVLLRLRAGKWRWWYVEPVIVDHFATQFVLCRKENLQSEEWRESKIFWGYFDDFTNTTRSWMDPELAFEERELAALYRRTRDSLPTRCREAFILVREEELSYAEAAQRLGTSVKMIAKSITQAQRVFRTALRKQGIEVPSEKGHEAPSPFISRAADEERGRRLRVMTDADARAAADRAASEREGETVFRAQLAALNRTTAFFRVAARAAEEKEAGVLEAAGPGR